MNSMAVKANDFVLKSKEKEYRAALLENYRELK
jgi:hypothetical protein